MDNSSCVSVCSVFFVHAPWMDNSSCVSVCSVFFVHAPWTTPVVFQSAVRSLFTLLGQHQLCFSLLCVLCSRSLDNTSCVSVCCVFFVHAPWTTPVVFQTAVCSLFTLFGQHQLCFSLLCVLCSRSLDNTSCVSDCSVFFVHALWTTPVVFQSAVCSLFTVLGQHQLCFSLLCVFCFALLGQHQLCFSLLCVFCSHSLDNTSCVSVVAG